MIVLRVIASMDPSSGGPCQGIRNFIPLLEKLGVQNEVVCMDDPAAAFLGYDSFPIYALGPSKNPWSYNKAITNWLNNNISRFDVIVIHGLWLYPGYTTYKVFVKLKKQVINGKVGKIPKLFVMPHGMLDPYFQKAPQRKFKAIRNWFYWKFIEGKIVNDSDGILYTCEEERRLGGQTFLPYNPKREFNVGYGIANPMPYNKGMTKAFIRKCPSISNQAYLLFLSRINEKKGLYLLINAYLQIIKVSKGLINEIPKLVIAGPGLNTSYGRGVQQLVDQDSLLKQTVYFTGMLSGEAKWGAFYGCEAFILPSHQENFGIAIVEALACGKPVLISNQVNIWREIESMGGGIVCEDNLAGTSKLIESWLSLSEIEKTIMEKNARSCFEDKFHINRNAQKFFEAINL